MNDRLWNIEETADFLSVPVETLRTWRKNKTGPRAGKMGRHLRYHPQHVRRWFEENGGAVT